MIAPNSLSNLAFTISGSGFPYILYAFSYVISFTIFSALSIFGGQNPSGTGFITSIISAIAFVPDTTISFAVSSPK